MAAGDSSFRRLHPKAATVIEALPSQRPVGLVLGGSGGATLDALPMPLGSLSELLPPPTLPGPDGMPLTPVVPAPAEPAFGVPTALPDPAAVPPAPAVCANDAAGAIKMAVTASANMVEDFDIGCSPV
jgi:hypothetical protein